MRNRKPMGDKLTGWYSARQRPTRTGFYQFNADDGGLLHWDSLTNTWGTWLRIQPGVRHLIGIEPDWRWRGRAQA